MSSPVIANCVLRDHLAQRRRAAGRHGRRPSASGSVGKSSRGSVCMLRLEPIRRDLDARAVLLDAHVGSGSALTIS